MAHTRKRSSVYAKLAQGDKCSGPCSNGYRCSSYCKEFAEEIKKMHDDFHHTAPGYCAYHRAIDFETLEEMNKGK
ncbi:hypothetical protein JRO89_XSUnG0014300 [Xanthoceras sorbifolium]|uniref:Uncharacterized protein n=1 Tax=Xanthoceras sorbifolium TaxID=99658 RepID=A0ABQ8H0B0_9ROSI|nr:hypothetical protein JRO89_XSUnG0014300 [Xanthoceras sorbifolium]